MSTNEKKNYLPTITGLYPPKNAGSVYTYEIVVSPKVYDALQTVKVGGKLHIKVRRPEFIKKEEDPIAYLEYASPEARADFKARMASENGNGGSSGAPESSL